jgi:large subunit ribosomal protein L10
MTNQRKIFTVQNLTEKLKDAKSLILTDYRGLTVDQISELREKVKESGGELEVVKNTLLARAATEAKVKFEENSLAGPTAVIWAWDDEIAPIKAVYSFSKEAGLPEIKSGLFGNEVILPDKIKELARLPGLEGLRAKLVGTLSSPTYGLVNSLNWNLKKLVYILKARQESKGGD